MQDVDVACCCPGPIVVGSTSVCQYPARNSEVQKTLRRTCRSALPARTALSFEACDEDCFLTGCAGQRSRLFFQFLTHEVQASTIEYLRIDHPSMQLMRCIHE